MKKSFCRFLVFMLLRRDRARDAGPKNSFYYFIAYMLLLFSAVLGGILMTKYQVNQVSVTAVIMSCMSFAAVMTLQYKLSVGVAEKAASVAVDKSHEIVAKAIRSEEKALEAQEVARDLAVAGREAAVKLSDLQVKAEARTDKIGELYRRVAQQSRRIADLSGDPLDRLEADRHELALYEYESRLARPEDAR